MPPFIQKKNEKKEVEREEEQKGLQILINLLLKTTP